MDRSTLERKPVGDLREIASTLSLTGVGRLRKADLIDRIMDEVNPAAEAAPDETLFDADASGSEAAGSEGSDESGSDGDDASDGSDEDTQDETSDASDGSDDDDEEDRARNARDEVIERRRARARGGRPVEARDARGNGTSSGGIAKGGRDDRDEAAEASRGQDGGRSKSNDTPSKQDDDEDRGNRNRNRNRSRNRGGNDQDDVEVRSGVLDLLPEGYGFLRTSGYVSGPQDVYVSQSYVRRFNLRRGDLLGGPVRFNKGNDKFPALSRLETCEGRTVSNEHDPLLRDRPDFDALTPVFPDERIGLETSDGPEAMRVLDLVAPIGKGQRGLVLAPPMAGSTTFAVQLAQAVEANAPDVHVMVVLIDERPEDVTDVERSVEGEVIASTFDRPAEDHTSVAELALERAKRLVERGYDVVVILDSLTRLARAYNHAVTTPGRTLDGGLDAAALHAPKRFFGAARNLEEGGSLTVIALARIDSGSRTDEVILEEFMGTGNMEARLLTGKTPGAFPSIDPTRSGTRRDDRLRAEGEGEAVWALRRGWAELTPAEALGQVLAEIDGHATNADALAAVKA